jgi:hypothetical protein
MTDLFGKMMRKQPIKCWGSKGDNMYKYYPHKGDRTMTMHNIQ